MPTVLQFRRGTTTQNEAFTGAVGELSVDTTLDTVRVHDGSTAGGIRLAKYSEIQSGDITAVVAGTGLSGGATSGSATVALSHLGLESLSDPNDDRIIFWDDSAGATAFLDIGTNLAVSGTTLSASTQTSLADADADTKIQVEEGSDEEVRLHRAPRWDRPRIVGRVYDAARDVSDERVGRLDGNVLTHAAGGARGLV